MRVLWDLDDDPDGNVQHIAMNDLTKEDVEDVVAEPMAYGTSQSSGRPCMWGYNKNKRHLMVIYEQVEEDLIYVVTAYEVDEPTRR